MKVLFVCAGNICRSPLAEGLLKHKALNAGLDWKVDSCATGKWHIGEIPNENSIAIAKKNGMDITYQKARQFHYTDFELFDLIFVMDEYNYGMIVSQAQFENEKEKVDYILNMTSPGENKEVPDPFYGEVDGYENVYNMLNKACEKIIEAYGK